MAVLQTFGGTVHWAQLPVYVCAELTAGVAAGLAYTLVSRGARRTVDIRATDVAGPTRATEPVA
jgi:glycerol uptake facilitator protein